MQLFSMCINNNNNNYNGINDARARDEGLRAYTLWWLWRSAVTRVRHEIRDSARARLYDGI